VRAGAYQSRNEPGKGRRRTGVAVGASHVQGPVAARFVGGGGEEDGVGWGVEPLGGGGEGGLEGGQVAGAGEVEDVVCFVKGEVGWGLGWHCGAWVRGGWTCFCVLVGVGDTSKIAIVALAGWGYELRIMKVVRWYCRGLLFLSR